METPLETGEAEIGSEGIGETDVEAVSEDIIEEPSYDFLEIDDDLANKMSGSKWMVKKSRFH